MKNSEEIYTELLTIQCRQGDNSAFMKLVRLYEQRLFFYIRRITGNEDDTWDILQQTWLVVFQELKKLRDVSRFAPWLYRIAHNRAVSQMRADKRQETVSLDDLEIDLPNGTDDDFDQWEAEEIRTALDTLSGPHREVLTLYFLEDFTIDEIANITDLPPGTVKSRLHYAKRAMKKVIKRGWLTHE